MVLEKMLIHFGVNNEPRQDTVQLLMEQNVTAVAKGKKS